MDGLVLKTGRTFKSGDGTVYQKTSGVIAKIRQMVIEKRQPVIIGLDVFAGSAQAESGKPIEKFQLICPLSDIGHFSATKSELQARLDTVEQSADIPSVLVEYAYEYWKTKKTAVTAGSGSVFNVEDWQDAT